MDAFVTTAQSSNSARRIKVRLVPRSGYTFDRKPVWNIDIQRQGSNGWYTTVIVHPYEVDQFIKTGYVQKFGIRTTLTFKREDMEAFDLWFTSIMLGL